MLERLRLRLNISWFKALAGIALVSTVAYAAQNFNSINVNGNITVTGTVDGRDVSTDGSVIDAITTNGVTALTSAEVDQLENINATTISSATWGFLGGINQALSSTSSPTFNSITGTLSTAAQTNITSLGTLTALSVDAPLNLLQQTTPANPAASRNKLYFKSDDKLYRLTSAGVETEVGSGGTSFDDSIFEIYDDGDITKLINFEASGITPGQTRTITMADANIDLAEISDATALNNAGTIVKRDGSGDFAAGTITAALTGNASTATALAANPTDCSANQFANAISASGNLTCAQPAFTDISGVATIANGGTNNGSLGVTAGGVVYTDGSKLMNTGAGTTGYVITSNGASAPTWSALPAGGTNDQREYVTNGKFETDASGWTTYDDASAVPVDCNGGTVSATFTRTTTVGEVIRETASGELTKDAADRQGEGVSYDFTLDYNDYNNLRGVPISFEYNNTSAFASGDILVYVYDKDAGGTPQAVQNIQSTTAGNILSSTGGTRWNGIYYPTTAASDDYRLCFHIATTNASAYDFHLDSVHIGNQNVTPGAIVSQWASCTVTGSWSSNTTYSCLKRRIGEDTEYQIKLALAGAPTSANLTVNLPSGDVIDTNKLADSTAGYSSLPGSNCSAIDAGNNGFVCTVAYSSTSVVSIMRALGIENGSAAPIATGNAVTQAAPFTFGSGDGVQFSFKVPLVNQAASAALSTTETLFSSAKFTAGKSATQTISTASVTKVNWSAATKDNLSGFDDTNDRYVVPKTGRYFVSTNLGYANASSETFIVSVYVNGSPVRAVAFNGATTSVPIAEEFDLVKGDYIEIFSDSAADTSYDVSATSTGATWFTVTERPDLSFFSVWGTTDYLSATASSTNLPTTTQFGDLTSLTLPPGEWDIGVNAIFHRNTTSEAAFTACNIGVSTTSGNSTSGLTLGVNWMQASQTFGFGSNFPMTLGGYRVTPTTTTTYYLKFAGTYSANQPQAEGTIYARKVK